MSTITIPRRLTEEGRDPYLHSDGRDLAWQKYRVWIGDENAPQKELDGVAFPEHFSENARNITWNHYFKQPREGEHETSLRAVIERLSGTITGFGEGQGVFAPGSADVFRDELAAILLHQYAAFNSPVWYNVGIEAKPQCSACFIQSVKDDMESIMDLAKSEVMLFKYGSGTGTNFSTIRSSREGLSGGGVASGPVSFMRGYDAFAGVTKSGGKTRRAAKMVILNVDHPDIDAFIETKRQSEKDAWGLEASGARAKTTWDDPAGAAQNVYFQNANHSVRVTDTFMKAVEADGDYYTKYVATGENCEKKRAREVFADMADAAWSCGDPGIQFDTTINKWHTCPKSGRIEASNPCSEYMFLNDSACNLASLRLTKFFDAAGAFDAEKYDHVIRVLITAMEILVEASSYPTPQIAENSRRFRPLGLGYCDLGTLLMTLGLPYDSTPACQLAGALTSLMSGTAYHQSAVLAEALGAFEGFEANRKDVLKVLDMHKKAAQDLTIICAGEPFERIATLGLSAWESTLSMARATGVRNSQISVMAPTGTISFYMDADTTGCEPMIGLVVTKQLANHAELTLVNRSVSLGLERLGYSDGPLMEILRYLEENKTLEGAPGLKDEHLAVFDTSLRQPNGTRFIAPMGHVRMMAGIQPFLSGAISKTVNLPEDTTREDIQALWKAAWKLGLKAVAIYRNGCKVSQPLTVAGSETTSDGAPAEPRPVRRRMPQTRASLTHRFSVSGHEGYVTVGRYEDGTPGELFVVMSKQGSVVSGLIDAFATSVSLNLQYGVPLSVLVKKFAHMRFEPAGFTDNRDIPIAKSIIDYIFRWLAMQFPEGGAAALVPEAPPPPTTVAKAALAGMEEKYCGECQYLGPMPGCACPSCGTTQACS